MLTFVREVTGDTPIVMAPHAVMAADEEHARFISRLNNTRDQPLGELRPNSIILSAAICEEARPQDYILWVYLKHIPLCTAWSPKKCSSHHAPLASLGTARIHSPQPVLRRRTTHSIPPLSQRGNIPRFPILF